MVSDLESCEFLDIESLCRYWQDMARYPTWGPKRCYRILSGFFLLSILSLGETQELDMLLSIIDDIVYTEELGDGELV